MTDWKGPRVTTSVNGKAEPPERQAEHGRRSRSHLRFRAALVVVIAALVVLLAVWVASTAPMSDIQAGRYARLFVYRGQAHISKVSDQRLLDAPSTIMQPGDSATTSADALAAIESHHMSRTRLESLTEVAVAAMSGSGVKFAQRSGSLYHYVEPGYGYEVDLAGVAVRGEACVFNTDFQKGLARIRVIAGEVHLAVGGKDEGSFGAGKEILAGTTGGEPYIAAGDIGRGVLTEPWYRWNSERNRSDGLKAIVAPR